MYSHLKDDEQRAYYKQLEAATSILDTMEGETLSNMSVSVYLYLTECIQLVTEDAINRKRHCHQEQQWSDGKLQYLLRLRRAIITCVCIHMLSDEDCEEVPILGHYYCTMVLPLSSFLRSYQLSVTRSTHSILFLRWKQLMKLVSYS